MSFGLPSIKTKPHHPNDYGLEEGEFGVPDSMKHGLSSARNALENVHPLAHSERNYRQNQDRMNLQVLRNIQGLHAPLRISMELKSAKKVGHLPFLKSSNVMYDSLTGRDLEVMPEDIFNTKEFCEVSVQPHAFVERSLGIL